MKWWLLILLMLFKHLLRTDVDWIACVNQCLFSSFSVIFLLSSCGRLWLLPVKCEDLLFFL